MGTAAGILNHVATAMQALKSNSASPTAAAASAASPAASPAGGTSSSTSDSATISANDFLTLLVTEMQNQDPTADVDPNEYINQLVSVNSLEQLISINQTLGTALGGNAATANGVPATTPAAGATSSSTGANASGASAQTQPAQSGSASASTGAATTLPGAIHAAAAELAPGNLGIPAANPAAQRVAQALSGRLGVQ